MELCSKKPIRTKTMISDRILERVSHLLKKLFFNYLRNDIGCDRNYNIDVKFDKFQTIFWTINCTFRNKVRRDKNIKVLQSYGSTCTALWM